LAFASPDLEGTGSGVVLVARPAGKKNVALATFVVDVQCLGVRKVTFSEVPLAALLNQAVAVLRVAPVPLGVARGIVEGAAAFAKKIGFPPPANLPEGVAFFEATAAQQVPFDFGVNGKPFYAQQPGDSEDFAESVLRRLEEKFGPGGFGFQLDEIGEEWIDGEDPEDGDLDDAEASAEEE
jgi:hypothetical protein